MSESTDTLKPETAPLMLAAANESIAAMFRRGCDLERQLAEATKQRNKLAKALRGLVSECEYQSKAGDFNADRIELSAARIALAALNQPEEMKP